MPRRASWADARATHGSNRRSGGGASPPADVPCADCECVRASGSSCRSFAVVRCTRSAGGRCLVAQSRRGAPSVEPELGPARVQLRGRIPLGAGPAPSTGALAGWRRQLETSRPSPRPARSCCHPGVLERGAVRHPHCRRVGRGLPVEAAQRRPGGAGHDRPGRGHPRAAGERGQHLRSACSCEPRSRQTSSSPQWLLGWSTSTNALGALHFPCPAADRGRNCGPGGCRSDQFHRACPLVNRGPTRFDHVPGQGQRHG